MSGSSRGRNDKNEEESKPRLQKKPEWTGYRHARAGPRVFTAAMKPDKRGRNGSCSTIFPFGLKAEFLAQQNRRPPPSFAQRFGPLVPRGCWPSLSDFL
jgi:hypothetical protein